MRRCARRIITGWTAAPGRNLRPMSDVECVWPAGAILGEGPVWSAAERAVWFVDIKSPAIHRFDTTSGEKRSWPAPARCGFVLPLRDGGHIAGLKTGLHRFSPD